jgi:hypothetical protein
MEQEYKNTVHSHIQSNMERLTKYVAPDGKEWLLYEPFSTNAFAYTEAASYKIPNSLIRLMKLRKINKLHARKITIYMSLHPPQPHLVNVIRFCGSRYFHPTEYNVLDWISFAGDDGATYSINCNPESKYYEKIMATYENYIGTCCDIIGDVYAFIEYINEWMNYTSAKYTTVDEALNMKCDIHYIVSAIKGIPGFVGNVTYKVALEKSNCTSHEAADKYKNMLDRISQKPGLVYNVKSKKNVKFSSEQEREQIIAENIEYLLQLPVISADGVKCVVADMYKKCVYTDIHAAQFSEWLIRKKLNIPIANKWT